MLTVYLAKFKAFEAFSDPSSTYPYSLIFTRGSHKLGTLHGWYHTLIHSLMLSYLLCSPPQMAPPSPVLALRFMLWSPLILRHIQISPPPSAYPAFSYLIKQNKVLRLLCSYITHTSIRTLVTELWNPCLSPGSQDLFKVRRHLYSSGIFLSLAQCRDMVGTQ